MAFSPQFLDELRTRVSLAAVVGRQVRLIKRGREYIGLCPFHKEKTPSFNVVEEKGFYHCFGCGAHGDVIGFSMRSSNLSFREAVEALAREAGLALPVESPRERERTAEAATLHDVCEAACLYFQSQLDGPKGARALEYLARRRVSGEQMRVFRLGYAPAAAGLTAELSPRFPEALLIAAGLLRKDEGGRTFEFFRDRVIFPIMDRRGRVIAFGGRTMGEAKPKYLNSPDSPIFQKGRTLFAFHLARQAIGPEAPPIVTEGYMDVIALYGAGFRSAVAPLGTALTEEQMAELWKLSPEPVLCFDGDSAGTRAAGRALERALPLLRPGLSLSFVTLPPGEDPDSLIQARGAQEFRRHLGLARQLSEYLWESATRGRSFLTPESLSRLEAELREKVLLIEDKQTQRLYARFVGDRSWELWRANRATEQKKKKHKIDYKEEISQWLDHAATRTRIELTLLVLAINHPQIVQAEIDQFAALHPARRELRDLHEKIMELMAGDPHGTAMTLRQGLENAGLGNSVNKIFNSDIYRSRRFAHPEASPDDVANGWSALFSRYLLPDLKAQLEEAEARLAAEMTEENWNSVQMYRALYEEQNTEAPLIRARWDGAERTTEWNPQAAA